VKADAESLKKGSPRQVYSLWAAQGSPYLRFLERVAKNRIQGTKKPAGTAGSKE
jgi:hypothetical protein